MYRSVSRPISDRVLPIRSKTPRTISNTIDYPYNWYPTLKKNILAAFRIKLNALRGKDCFHSKKMTKNLYCQNLNILQSLFRSEILRWAVEIVLLLCRVIILRIVEKSSFNSLLNLVLVNRSTKKLSEWYENVMSSQRVKRSPPSSLLLNWG